MTQAAIEATKTVVQAMASARAKADAIPRTEATSTRPKLGRPPWKQPTFDWSTTEKAQKFHIGGK